MARLLPSSTRRVVLPHPAEQLDAFAQLAGGETLLDVAMPVARALLKLHGQFQVWEVRLELILADKSDGTEPAAAYGALGRRLGLRRAGSARTPSKVPYLYLRRATAWQAAAMERLLEHQHCNVGTIWREPTLEEARQDAERALEKLSTSRRRPSLRLELSPRSPHPMHIETGHQSPCTD